jgi:hypothetical protein
MVSVVIATFNRANLLSETLRSVFSQTYCDFEIVVIDDGSTDDTRKVVAQLAGECPQVRYFYQANQGRSAARNRGIEMARGKYVAFLDSDDIWLPSKLETQVTALETRPEYAMAYSSAAVIDDAGNLLPHVYRASASGDIYPDVAFYVPVTVLLPTVLVRTDALRHVGPFDVQLDRFEDTDMWRRLSRCNRVLAIREPLCKVRTHADNRLAAQDPDLLVLQVTQYVCKVVAEDGAGHPVFVRQGASRLCAHYGRAILSVPGWTTHGRKLLALSLRYRPLQPYLWCLWALASLSLSPREGKRNGPIRRLLLRGFMGALTPRQTAYHIAGRAKGAFRDHSPPWLYEGLKKIYRTIFPPRPAGSHLG